MKVIPKPGVLQQLQDSKNMTDQEFADYVGTSRSSIWRAKLSPDDKRFSLGQDVMAKILKKFPEKAFEELFFLDSMSHECYKGEQAAAKEVI